MAWARRQLAVAHRPQFAAERLLRDDDRELVPDPLAKIDDAPADHTVNGRNGAAVDRRRQRNPMPPVEQRWLSRCLAIYQTPWPVCIEPQHPVPDDLPRHPAHLGCLGARRPVVDGCERQQAADLLGVLALARRQTHARRVVIRPERDWHRETPPIASLESDLTRVGQDLASRAQ